MTQASDRHSLEQIPPHSLELEYALIGSFLVSFSSQDALGVLEVLAPEHFYDPACKLIYAAIMELHRAFRPVDLSMVGDRLNSNGSLKAIGGREGLVQIQMAAPLDTNPIAYAIEIKDKWIRRQLHEAHRKGAIAAYDTSKPLEECCSISESLVHDATKARHTGDGGLVQIADLLSPAIANLEAINQGTQTPGVQTGFRDLDALTLGLERSALCIIAARPAMGKTTFALNVAVNVAKLGLPVAFFSLEMNKDQILVSRILSSAARIDSTRLRAGRINASDWESIGLAAGRLAELPLYLDDTSDITTSEIISKVLRLKSEVGQVGMVVIDYLQLLGSDSQSNNRVAELTKMTRQLKGLAGRINAPVIALSQLSRATESRTNHRPVMSDLRECLTANAMVTLPDGNRVSIADIKPGMEVLAVDESQKLVPAKVSQHFVQGVKPVYRVTTSMGRSLECTADHPLLTQRGYVALENLELDDLVATAYRSAYLPDETSNETSKARLLGYLLGNGSMIHGTSFCTPFRPVLDDFCELVEQYFPGANFNIELNGSCWEVDVAYHYVGRHGKPFGNPLRNWLRSLGLTGKTAKDKFVPDWALSLGAKGAAQCLAGLLYTDGCVKVSSRACCIDTCSDRLAKGVMELMFNCGIACSVSLESKKEAHHQQMKRISVCKDSLLIFCSLMPLIGEKGEKIKALMSAIFDVEQSGKSSFALPRSVSEKLSEKTTGLRQPGTRKADGELRKWRHQGKTVSREICDRYARQIQDDELLYWANSDLLWESVKSVESIGVAETYDITVDGLHNFIANGIAVHNCGSIEQDASLILMPYRDEYYNPDTPDRGVAEIIVAKQRNGPTGTAKLLFEPQFTTFRDMRNV